MNRVTQAKLQAYGAWALVTGASDGIGRSFARELAAAGLNLILVARREDELQALAVSLQHQFAVSCRVIALDLSRRDAIDRLHAETADLEVGLLVAAAGFGSAGPLLAQSPSSEADMVQVNCVAVLQQCRCFGASMARRRRGGVVLFSSLVGFHGTPWSANYAASKAYVQSLAEGLRVEWAALGVDVIACAPGPVATGFGRRARMTLNRAEEPDVVARQTLAALGQRTTIRPGGLAKLLGWGLGTAPRALRVRIMGLIMKGMARSPSQ
jgi:short-subunit dehydrogenase